MSYKTELQSNNTDIQTIDKYVDEFGSLIAGQNNLIAQMQTALEGKAIVSNGEPSVNDIGVFTWDCLPNVQFLFIKGMTFGEYCSSKMNRLVFDKDGYLLNLTADSEDVWSEYVDSGSFLWMSLSEDGITSCNQNTIITEIDYKTVDLT